MPQRSAVAVTLSVWLASALARADGPQAPPAAPPPPVPALLPTASGLKGPNVTINGYVEVAYTYSLQQPSNGVIEDRGFDNRHNTFTIQNAVIDTSANISGLSARIALQVGQTPTTYYAAEPTLPGGPDGAGRSTPDDWKYIQQAYGGYTTSKVGQSLAIEAGIFLSPIGPEVMQAKDDWNYSRSNLFFALPFYHTGGRLTLQASDRTSLSLWVVNGWNSVVDNNPGKSIIATYAYKIPDRLSLQLLYMGGPERPSGAPDGQPNRHLFDAYAQVDIVPALSVLAEANTGFEHGVFGTSAWAAGAAYARVRPVSWLYVAGRGDAFAEHRGAGPLGTASRIFFPASLVGSGTFTIDGRPHDNVSLRLEYRHDQASSDMYFSGTVKGDGVKTPFVADARSQDTITAAALAWF